jgi:hypothetical protein
MPKSVTWTLVAAFFMAIAAGCTPTDDPGGSTSGSNPTDLQAAVNAEYGDVSQESSRISQRTPEDQLVAARKKAADLLASMDKLSRPNQVDLARKEAVQAEMKRIDAALVVRSSRKRWDDLFAKAVLTPRQKKLSTAQQRAILRGDWPEFRKADDDLLAAERAYTDATNGLAAALKREQQMSEATGAQ